MRLLRGAWVSIWRFAEGCSHQDQVWASEGFFHERTSSANVDLGDLTNVQLSHGISGYVLGSIWQALAVRLTPELDLDEMDLLFIQCTVSALMMLGISFILSLTGIVAHLSLYTSQTPSTRHTSFTHHQTQ